MASLKVSSWVKHPPGEEGALLISGDCLWCCPFALKLTLSIHSPLTSWRHPKESSFPCLFPVWTKAFLSICFQICCAPALSSSLWLLLNFFHGVDSCLALDSPDWKQDPRCSQAQWCLRKKKISRIRMRRNRSKFSQPSLLELSKAVALVLTWVWEVNPWVRSWCAQDTDFSKRRQQSVNDTE